jgi:hypothetical protein
VKTKKSSTLLHKLNNSYAHVTHMTTHDDDTSSPSMHTVMPWDVRGAASKRAEINWDELLPFIVTSPPSTNFSCILSIISVLSFFQ